MGAFAPALFLEKEQAQSFPNGTVDPAALSWDFLQNDSNYAELRQGLLGLGDGRTWSNAYAKKGSLLSPIINPITGEEIRYETSDAVRTSSIGWRYAFQGIYDGENGSTACGDVFDSIASSTDVVVDDCTLTGTGGTGGGGAGGTGGTGGGKVCDPSSVGPGRIAASTLVCGLKLDDMAVALTGMHPADVWVTRLEASLPRAALADDLDIEAAPQQVAIENWLQATQATSAPCQLATASAPPPRPPASRARNRIAVLLALLGAVAATIGRRVRRSALARAAR